MGLDKPALKMSTSYKMSDPTCYEIRIREVLDEKWGAHFAPFTLTPCEDETRLIGSVQDQAELFGILLKIRDSWLRLISANPV
jgi:hypothetical protein